MRKLSALLFACLLVCTPSITGCDVAPQPATVVAEQAPCASPQTCQAVAPVVQYVQQPSNNNGMLEGLLIGHMLSGGGGYGGNSSSYRSSTVVNHYHAAPNPTPNPVVAPRPAYAPTPAQPVYRPSVQSFARAPYTPSYSRSFSTGGRR